MVLNCLLLCFLLFYNVQSAAIPILCPNVCVCDMVNDYRSAVCQNKSLESVEIGIPSAVQLWDMSHNKISELQGEVFSDLQLSDLKFLNLSYNIINEIDLNSFEGLDNLKSLDLSYNNIYYLRARWFSDLISLRELYLRANQLADINNQPTMNLPGLKVLDISNNRIEDLYPITFNSLPNLEILDISDNLLKKLLPEIFTPLPNLRLLVTEGNNFNCKEKPILSLKIFLKRNDISHIDPCGNNFTRSNHNIEIKNINTLNNSTTNINHNNIEISRNEDNKTITRLVTKRTEKRTTLSAKYQEIKITKQIETEEQNKVQNITEFNDQNRTQTVIKNEQFPQQRSTTTAIISNQTKKEANLQTKIQTTVTKTTDSLPIMKDTMIVKNNNNDVKKETTKTKDIDITTEVNSGTTIKDVPDILENSNIINQNNNNNISTGSKDETLDDKTAECIEKCKRNAAAFKSFNSNKQKSNNINNSNKNNNNNQNQNNNNNNNNNGNSNNNNNILGNINDALSKLPPIALVALSVVVGTVGGAVAGANGTHKSLRNQLKNIGQKLNNTGKKLLPFIAKSNNGPDDNDDDDDAPNGSNIGTQQEKPSDPHLDTDDIQPTSSKQSNKDSNLDKKSKNQVENLEAGDKKSKPSKQDLNSRKTPRRKRSLDEEKKISIIDEEENFKDRLDTDKKQQQLLDPADTIKSDTSLKPSDPLYQPKPVSKQNTSPLISNANNGSNYFNNTPKLEEKLVTNLDNTETQQISNKNSVAKDLPLDNEKIKTDPKGKQYDPAAPEDVSNKDTTYQKPKPSKRDLNPRKTSRRKRSLGDDQNFSDTEEEEKSKTEDSSDNHDTSVSPLDVLTKPKSKGPAADMDKATTNVAPGSKVSEEIKDIKRKQKSLEANSDETKAYSSPENESKSQKEKTDPGSDNKYNTQDIPSDLSEKVTDDDASKKKHDSSGNKDTKDEKKQKNKDLLGKVKDSEESGNETKLSDDEALKKKRDRSNKAKDKKKHKKKDLLGKRGDSEESEKEEHEKESTKKVSDDEASKKKDKKKQKKRGLLDKEEDSEGSDNEGQIDPKQQEDSASPEKKSPATSSTSNISDVDQNKQVTEDNLSKTSQPNVGLTGTDTSEPSNQLIKDPVKQIPETSDNPDVDTENQLPKADTTPKNMDLDIQHEQSNKGKAVSISEPDQLQQDLTDPSQKLAEKVLISTTSDTDRKDQSLDQNIPKISEDTDLEVSHEHLKSPSTIDGINIQNQEDLTDDVKQTSSDIANEVLKDKNSGEKLPNVSVPSDLQNANEPNDNPSPDITNSETLDQLPEKFLPSDIANPDLEDKNIKDPILTINAQPQGEPISPGILDQDLKDTVEKFLIPNNADPSSEDFTTGKQISKTSEPSDLQKQSEQFDTEPQRETSSAEILDQNLIPSNADLDSENRTVKQNLPVPSESQEETSWPDTTKTDQNLKDATDTVQQRAEKPLIYGKSDPNSEDAPTEKLVPTTSESLNPDTAKPKQNFAKQTPEMSPITDISNKTTKVPTPNTSEQLNTPDESKTGSTNQQNDPAYSNIESENDEDISDNDDSAEDIDPKSGFEKPKKPRKNRSNRLLGIQDLFTPLSRKNKDDSPEKKHKKRGIFGRGGDSEETEDEEKSGPDNKDPSRGKDRKKHNNRGLFHRGEDSEGSEDHREPDKRLNDPDADKDPKLLNLTEHLRPRFISSSPPKDKDKMKHKKRGLLGLGKHSGESGDEEEVDNQNANTVSVDLPEKPSDDNIDPTKKHLEPKSRSSSSSVGKEKKRHKRRGLLGKLEDTEESEDDLEPESKQSPDIIQVEETQKKPEVDLSQPLQSRSRSTSPKKDKDKKKHKRRGLFGIGKYSGESEDEEEVDNQNANTVSLDLPEKTPDDNNNPKKKHLEPKSRSSSPTVGKDIKKHRRRGLLGKLAGTEESEDDLEPDSKQSPDIIHVEETQKKPELDLSQPLKPRSRSSSPKSDKDKKKHKKRGLLGLGKHSGGSRSSSPNADKEKKKHKKRGLLGKRSEESEGDGESDKGYTDPGSGYKQNLETIPVDPVEETKKKPRSRSSSPKGDKDKKKHKKRGLLGKREDSEESEYEQKPEKFSDNKQYTENIPSDPAGKSSNDDKKHSRPSSFDRKKDKNKHRNKGRNSDGSDIDIEEHNQNAKVQESAAQDSDNSGNKHKEKRDKGRRIHL